MQQESNLREAFKRVSFLVGTADTILHMKDTPSFVPFSDTVVDFLNVISQCLLKNRTAKEYPDVVTIGFWLRKTSLNRLKKCYLDADDEIWLGRGVVFHIAPSNVPVNFAYSLFTGLLTGNANIVRIPSKNFPQIDLLIQAIEMALEKFESMKPYIALVRYGHDQDITDVLSALCDVRMIWGGNETISQIRKSSIPPRSYDITFADRFSLALIDSDIYLRIVQEDENRQKRIALDFYNDTYLSDQNACTSPRLIAWTGRKKEEAKTKFWEELHKIVKAKYEFQPIMAVDKLTNSYIAAVRRDVNAIETSGDNLIFRIMISKLDAALLDYQMNSGIFFEYDCDDIMELRNLCNDKRIQTIGIIGEAKSLKPLLQSGVRGIDRITPIGKTMDFDLYWDGYDLVERLSRKVSLRSTVY